MLGTLGFTLQIVSIQERKVTVKYAKSKQNTKKKTTPKPHVVLIPQSGIFQIMNVFP